MSMEWDADLGKLQVWSFLISAEFEWMDTIEIFSYCEIPQQIPGEWNVTGKQKKVVGEEA